MMRPLLLRSGCHLYPETELRRKALLGDFGALLEAEIPAEPRNPFDASNASHAEWRRAMAEELLLRHACGRNVPDPVLAQFAGVSPFDGSGPTLGALWDKRCACAVFPLAGQGGENSEAGVAHIWVIEGLDYRREPRDGIDAIPADLYVGFVATDDPWSGRSWQLAGALAVRALADSTVPELRHQLATEWIVTGAMRRNRVARVEMGNKLALRTDRRWLIPFENVPNVAPRHTHLHIRSAGDVDTAWSHITDVGVKVSEEDRWPDHVDALHVLVGGNIKAAVASALFCPADIPITIWQSGSERFSRTPASAFRIVLHALRPTQPFTELQELSSSDLAQAEKTLRQHFRSLALGSRVLFNVTSGNRLMSYAVQSTARLYPNVELVYRDADAAPFAFNHLRYSDFPPHLGTLIGTPVGRELSEEFWSYIHERAREVTDFTPDEIAEVFIKKAQP